MSELKSACVSLSPNPKCGNRIAYMPSVRRKPEEMKEAASEYITYNIQPLPARMFLAVAIADKNGGDTDHDNQPGSR
jgi:hypothetical protein